MAAGADRIGVGPDGRLRRNPATTRTESIGSTYECDTDRLTLAAMDNDRTMLYGAEIHVRVQ